MERALGQEFASAFLSVLYPHGRSECETSAVSERETSAVSEREASYRRILEEDLEGADTDRKEDQLTFGLYSVFGKSPALMAELVLYAKSAKGDVELRSVDEAQGASNFPCVSGFGGQLYDLFCHRFFLYPSTSSWWSLVFPSTTRARARRTFRN